MSVLIKGMEMPKCCCVCPCFNDEYLYCQAADKDLGSVLIDRRHPDCPLIEISPVIVDPVVHGQWIFHDDKPLGFNTECSVCHAEGMLDGYYCPNCGAKMDLVI